MCPNIAPHIKAPTKDVVKGVDIGWELGEYLGQEPKFTPRVIKG
ncbi:hypothetical protein HBZC1_p0670 (plasmid) [Helicobacter bizzozeronii CIII-1]|uniref:Uncharacterized protein n=1 Tax=Helicobacter bizzozeronii (strain CIII-1) TaxID=1002804 RepID=F8KUL2_HELBC|nr:hypothetical protein HBZC1_p0670 [Helicobacter bizzozeronii CIII-1]